MGASKVVEPALETIDGARPEPALARDRTWERAQRAAGEVATYRGIPPELQAAIKRIANELRVPVGKVAAAFLRYAVEDYESGRLAIEASPAASGAITRLSRGKAQ